MPSFTRSGLPVGRDFSRLPEPGAQVGFANDFGVALVQIRELFVDRCEGWHEKGHYKEPGGKGRMRAFRMSTIPSAGIDEHSPTKGNSGRRSQAAASHRGFRARSASGLRVSVIILWG